MNSEPAIFTSLPFPLLVTQVTFSHSHYFILPSLASIMKPGIKAHMAMAASALLFGVNYWVAKGLMPDIFSPFQVIFLRVLGACIIFGILYLFTKNNKIEKKDWWRLILAGFFGISANQLLFFTGLNYSSPIDVSLIHLLNPIFVLVLSALFLSDKITWTKVIGIILGGIGAMMLILPGQDLASINDSVTGNLLILGNTLAYSVYLVLIKPIMQKYKPIQVMFWVFLFGFLFIIPLTIQTTMQLEPDTIDTRAWLDLAYVVIAVTVGAYLLIVYALQNIKASVASFYVYFQPIIVVFIGIMFMQESLSFLKVLAALLIFTGVFIVSRKSVKNKLNKAANRA